MLKSQLAKAGEVDDKEALTMAEGKSKTLEEQVEQLLKDNKDLKDELDKVVMASEQVD